MFLSSKWLCRNLQILVLMAIKRDAREELEGGTWAIISKSSHPEYMKVFVCLSVEEQCDFYYMQGCTLMHWSVGNRIRRARPDSFAPCACAAFVECLVECATGVNEVWTMWACILQFSMWQSLIWESLRAGWGYSIRVDAQQLRRNYRHTHYAPFAERSLNSNGAWASNACRMFVAWILNWVCI